MFYHYHPSVAYGKLGRALKDYFVLWDSTAITGLGVKAAQATGSYSIFDQPTHHPESHSTNSAQAV